MSIYIERRVSQIYTIDTSFKNRAAWKRVTSSTIYRASAVGVPRYMILITIERLNYVLSLIENLNRLSGLACV